MEESRTQFEAWFSNDGKYPEAVDKSGGDYLLASACAAWEAWQASRAAVEIELPSDDRFCDDEAVSAVNNCANIVRAAGIKVKRK